MANPSLTLAPSHFLTPLDMYVVHFEREKYNPRNDIMTAKDTTPLMTACYYGHLRTVELLIAGGADVNCSTDNTNTALIVAAAKGQTGCALKLMEAGAQVNKCNIFGWKPLHFAAHGGFADIVIELLKNGARDSLAIYSTDLDQRNPKSKRAQEMAIDAGHEEVVNVFNIQLTKIPKVRASSQIQ